MARARRRAPPRSPTNATAASAAAAAASSPAKKTKFVYKDDLESLNPTTSEDSFEEEEDEFTEEDAKRAARINRELEVRDGDHSVESDKDENGDDDSDEEVKEKVTMRNNKITTRLSPKGKAPPKEMNAGIKTEDIDNDEAFSTPSSKLKIIPERMSRSSQGRHKRSGYVLQTVDIIQPDPAITPPSNERFTENGGYAHTLVSRARISAANRGNTPWNKGKTRSSSDRAKIAAGVRARNRAMLLAKLERLGITEEEWIKKKKVIKGIRNKIRNAKSANKKHAEKMLKKDLDKLIDETTEPKDSESKAVKLENVKHEVNSPPAPSEALRKKASPKKRKLKDPPSASKSTYSTPTKRTRGKPSTPTDEAKDNGNDEDDSELDGKPRAVDTPGSRVSLETTVGEDSDDEDSVLELERMTDAEILARAGAPPEPKVPDGVFVREIEWAPHVLDTDHHSKLCPNGGPGGLTCCGPCTKLFSDYLTEMSLNMEQYKINKAGRDVQEIQAFLGDAQTALNKAVDAAEKTTPPPLPPHIRNEIQMPDSKAAKQQQKDEKINNEFATEVLTPMDLGDLSNFGLFTL